MHCYTSILINTHHMTSSSKSIAFDASLSTWRNKRSSAKAAAADDDVDDEDDDDDEDEDDNDNEDVEAFADDTFRVAGGSLSFAMMSSPGISRCPRRYSVSMTVVNVWRDKP
jgi:hypothetical protein